MEVEGKVNVHVGEQWPGRGNTKLDGTSQTGNQCSVLSLPHWSALGSLQSVASPAGMQILLPLYLCGCYRTAAGARPVTFFLEVLLAFLPSDDRSVQAVLA